MNRTEDFLTSHNMHELNTTDTALRSAGINAPEEVLKPDMHLPNLADIPDNMLATYYSQWESYAGWINYCRSRRQADLMSIEKDYRIKKVELYKKYSGSDLKVKDIEMCVNFDLLGFEDQIVQIKVDLEILKSILDDAEKHAKSFSREISMRTAGTALRRGVID